MYSQLQNMWQNMSYQPPRPTSQPHYQSTSSQDQYQSSYTTNQQRKMSYKAGEDEEMSDMRREVKGMHEILKELRKKQLAPPRRCERCGDSSHCANECPLPFEEQQFEDVSGFYAPQTSHYPYSKQNQYPHRPAPDNHYQDQPHYNQPYPNSPPYSNSNWNNQPYDHYQTQPPNYPYSQPNQNSTQTPPNQPPNEPISGALAEELREGQKQMEKTLQDLGVQLGQIAATLNKLLDNSGNISAQPPMNSKGNMSADTLENEESLLQNKKKRIAGKEEQKVKENEEKVGLPLPNREKKRKQRELENLLMIQDLDSEKEIDLGCELLSFLSPLTQASFLQEVEDEENVEACKEAGLQMKQPANHLNMKEKSAPNEVKMMQKTQELKEAHCQCCKERKSAAIEGEVKLESPRIMQRIKQTNGEEKQPTKHQDEGLELEQPKEEEGSKFSYHSSHSQDQLQLKQPGTSALIEQLLQFNMKLFDAAIQPQRREESCSSSSNEDEEKDYKKLQYKERRRLKNRGKKKQRKVAAIKQLKNEIQQLKSEHGDATHIAKDKKKKLPPVTFILT